MKPVITDIPGIGPAAAETLAEHRIRSLAGLARASIEKIAAIPGFSEARATIIIAAAADLTAASGTTPAEKAKKTRKIKRTRGKAKAKRRRRTRKKTRKMARGKRKARNRNSSPASRLLHVDQLDAGACLQANRAIPAPSLPSPHRPRSGCLELIITW